MDIYNKIFEDVAKEYDLPVREVKRAYMSMWRYLRKEIVALPLKGEHILTEEEFNDLNPQFNIPSIGKLNVQYDKYLRLKNRYLSYKNLIKEEDAEAKQDDEGADRGDKGSE